MRAGTVRVKDQKDSCARRKNGNEYALPIGHIKIGETLEDDPIRETMKETDVRIKCRRLLCTKNVLGMERKTGAYHLPFYYLVDACNDLETRENGAFVSIRDKKR